jgi:ribosome biogenesis protein ERB1
MLTDEEDVAPARSDDDETEEFPEISSGSDSEEESEDGHEQPSEDDSDESDSDASLQIFPKAKTEISDITGKPKRVYPDIEADYDSDSSTEDVRLLSQPVLY